MAKSMQVRPTSLPEAAADKTRALIARETGACIEQEQPQPAGGFVPELLSDYLFNCERSHLDKVLRANSGRIGDSAAALGIGRKSLWKK